MKFDLHVHTDASPDSRATFAEMLSAAKRAGLSGIAVCNHNVFSPPPESELLCIPACEYSTDVGHLLVYFLIADLELDRDPAGRFHWQDVIARAHEQGALVFLAHPFAPEVSRPPELFSQLDGVEAYNARIVHSRAPRPNERAAALSARAYSAGSDAHDPAEVGAAYWEIPGVSTLEEVRSALAQGRGALFGGTANPLCRAKSQWIAFAKKPTAKKLLKNLVRTVYSAGQAVFVPRVPIHPIRKDEPHETV